MKRPTKTQIAAAVSLVIVSAAVYLAVRASSTATRSGPLTTDTYSRDLAEAEKLPFLARYLKLCSEVEATDFHITYHNNGGGLVPGPSEWNIRVVMKVRPDDIASWTADVTPFDPSGGTRHNDDPRDLGWAQKLLSLDERWRTTSTPKIYTRGVGVVVAVFEPEGIVCKRVVAY